MTSASVEAGRAIAVAEVKPVLAARLGEAFGRDFAPAAAVSVE
jgi:hypothetical protein